MPDETNIQRIKEYLEQHRSQYTLPELRAQLVAAGYAPEDIDAAIAQLGATPVVAAPEASEPVPATSELAPPASNVAPNDEAEIVRMAGYLRQHAGAYSLDALREQLLAAGQPPALIEQAIARVQTEQQVQPRPKRWPLIIGLAILNTFLLPVVAYLLALPFSDGDAVIGNAIVTAVALLFAELVAGLVLLFPQRTTWLGKSLLLSVAISVVLMVILVVVGVILLAGTCLVMLRNL